MTSTCAVRIRHASAADESGVRACVDAAYGPYVKRIGKPPAPMLDDYAALIKSEVVHVATSDGRLVGLVVMWPEEDHLYIDNIAVLPEAQGIGVGGALLGFADQEAQRIGLNEIRLYTHEKMTENIQYYPRKGFRETHRATDAGYQRVYPAHLAAGRRAHRLARHSVRDALGLALVLRSACGPDILGRVHHSSCGCMAHEDGLRVRRRLEDVDT